MPVGTDSLQQWRDAFEAYKNLIHDHHFDSEYLRGTGLVPHMIDLIGDVRDLHVLDAGCGTGWLLDAIEPLVGDECDLVPTTGRCAAGIRTRYEDVRALTYA